jgi:hypothetical protein
MPRLFPDAFGEGLPPGLCRTFGRNPLCAQIHGDCLHQESLHIGFFDLGPDRQSVEERARQPDPDTLKGGGHSNMVNNGY